MAIYLTKQTSIDGVLQPVGKRIDEIAPEGTCRSLIRAGRALVRPARGDDREPPAPAALEPEDDSDEIDHDDDSDLLGSEADLFDDSRETDEIEHEDEDAVDVEFEVEPVKDEVSGDDAGGVPMDEIADDIDASAEQGVDASAAEDAESGDARAVGEDAEFSDLDPAAGSSDAESGDSAAEDVSIHTLGLSPAIASRLDALGIKTKADALRHAEKHGGRFGEELPGIGDVKAQRINAALGL